MRVHRYTVGYRYLIKYTGRLHGRYRTVFVGKGRQIYQSLYKLNLLEP